MLKPTCRLSTFAAFRRVAALPCSPAGIWASAEAPMAATATTTIVAFPNMVFPLLRRAGCSPGGTGEVLLL
jgi:hypothetical protein